MSRSRRQSVIKDGPRNSKKSSQYWRPVRRVMNQTIRGLDEDSEEENIPDPKEIVNDYDRSDYTFDMRFDKTEMSKKAGRK
jgi:hypothetical protein